MSVRLDMCAAAWQRAEADYAKAVAQRDTDVRKVVAQKRNGHPNVSEVAAAFGLTRRTVYKIIERGTDG